MNIRQVTPLFSVADQLTGDDLAAIRAQGYQTLICNRPDGETDGQPAAAELARQAQALGLDWVWIPISSGNFTDQAIAEFDAALSGQTQPVLAFCRSGTRSITLWALSQAGTRPAAALLEQCAAAGYDLSAQRERLEARFSG